VATVGVCSGFDAEGPRGRREPRLFDGIGASSTLGFGSLAVAGARGYGARMRLPGRTERRLALALLLVAVLPLAASVVVARSLLRRATSLFFNADVGTELDRSLSIYGDLAKAMKETLRARADAIAAQESLRAAALLAHGPSIDDELRGAVESYPDLVSIAVCSAPLAPPDGSEAEEVPEGTCGVANGGRELGRAVRKAPADPRVERTLEVRRPIRVSTSPSKEGGSKLPTREVVAVFAAPRARLDDVTRAAEFTRAYRAIERQRLDVERIYLIAFAALLGTTIALSAVLGSLLARNVTKRIRALSEVTREVAAGNLAARVDDDDNDEIAELGQAFNRMLVEVEESRARIEFLRRMGAWQEMARRLAHEIKNPLTPIQLAVEECHRRYRGDDASFRKVLDLTQEIVSEEVATLRRLVTEFSSFARLPHAELQRGDLGVFLREQERRLTIEDASEETSGLLDGVDLSLDVPAKPLPVALDPQMLHRVFVNVLGNAAQAIRARSPHGRIEMVAREDRSFVVVDIDDNGPGIDPELRDRVFDPYVTTKADGTGLGLAIVKKIIVEHGGTVEVADGRLGGARIRIRIPLWGTLASDAALSDSPKSGESVPSLRTVAPRGAGNSAREE
jgi:nitrogen fixation/metabolism regulation signal transduction histidine kinase